MGSSTSIEWTDATWNPTEGCALVSPGCTNCYAMKIAARFSGPGQPYEGLAVRTKTGGAWTGDIRLRPDRLDLPLRWRKPRRVFVDSMSDLFYERFPAAFIAQAYARMAAVPRHLFQILTKRPERAAAWYADHPEAHGLPNVWLGVSVEDGPRAARIDVLRAIPAALRFLSIEPLIAPIGRLDLDGIGWVITGGESGERARLRPCDPAWVREVRDRCAAAGVPFFHKQWGDWRNNPLVAEAGLSVARASRLDPDPDAKGGAGLDGRLWREMPAA